MLNVSNDELHELFQPATDLVYEIIAVLNIYNLQNNTFCGTQRWLKNTEMTPEDLVLEFLKKEGFPRIRKGETNKNICDYLKDNGYKYTPDLVSGPDNIREAPIEGLFFIDVISPSTEMLFESIFFKNSEVDVPKDFLRKFLQKQELGQHLSIRDASSYHHKCYLQKLNQKLNKYGHKRKYSSNGDQFVSANVGIVHHFNLGSLDNGKISKTKKLITALDYIRFYSHLSERTNSDIISGETLLLEELFNDNQNEPCVVAIERDLGNIPCLFIMLHISIKKDDKINDLAFFLYNANSLKNLDLSYPVHNWIFSKLFKPTTTIFQDDEYKKRKITLKINAVDNLFKIK